MTIPTLHRWSVAGSRSQRLFDAGELAGVDNADIQRQAQAYTRIALIWDDYGDEMHGIAPNGRRWCSLHYEGVAA
jgi:hypothetical protein